MGISDITEFFEKYGFSGVFLLIVVLLIVGLLRSDWFGTLISKFGDYYIEKVVKKKKKQDVKEITESDIINHDVIKFIDFWTYSKVPTFKFSTDYRTVVFRRYLTIYLQGYKKNISDFINSGKFKEMDDAEIWKNSLNLINHTIFDYETEMKQSGIPDIIIEKMKVKNNDTLTLTIDLIEGICNSQFYSSQNNLLKVYSILNILLSVLDNTIAHSDNVCNSINGQLRGLSFGGYTEP
jgi:hypothetical protein